MLNEKTDRELIVLKIDLQKALAQIQANMQAVDAELARRYEEEKKKDAEGIQ